MANRKRLQRGDIFVETEKQSYSKMLLGLTQLAGVPVKVSPHRSLNTSRGVIRSRDIADCNVEEVVEELQPQGVTLLLLYMSEMEIADVVLIL